MLGQQSEPHSRARRERRRERTRTRERAHETNVIVDDVVTNATATARDERRVETAIVRDSLAREGR